MVFTRFLSLLLGLSLLSYTPQGHLLRDGTAHSGQGPSTLVISLESALQICNLIVTFSQLRLTLPT